MPQDPSQDNSWQSLLNMSPPAGNYVDHASLTFDDLLSQDYNDPLGDLNGPVIKQETAPAGWDTTALNVAEDPTAAPYEITMPPRRTQTMPTQPTPQQLQQQQIRQIQAARAQCLPPQQHQHQHQQQNQPRRSFDGANNTLFTPPLQCSLACVDKIPNVRDALPSSQPRPSLRRANHSASSTGSLSNLKCETSVSPTAVQRTPASASSVSKPSPSNSFSADDESPAASSTTGVSATKSKANSNAASTITAPADDLDSKDRRKTAHSRIERRYRAKMNAKFAALKDAIPALQQPGKPGSGAAPWGPNDCDDMDIEDLAANAKPNKTTILTQAAGYIQQMEKQTQQMNREIEFLQSRVKALEKLASCEDCWLLASMGNLSFNPAVAAQSGA